MNMTYEQLINRIVDDGIKAARESYKDQPDKLRGSMDGFEACRTAPIAQLSKLHANAENEAMRCRAVHDDIGDYWRWRCFALEVEWVMNVVSVGLVNAGQDALKPHLPTMRGALKYAEILAAT